MKKEIESYIEEINSFGLVLPNGWFGRPFDNCHEMTWLEEKDNKLIIELDKQLYLIFTKPVSCTKQENDLIISNFKQLVFDYQGYGDMKPYCKIFKNGEVKLVGYSQ